MSKQGKLNLYNMLMLPFGRAVLLVSVRTRHVMNYANFIKEGVKYLIFPTPVRLEHTNFCIKETLNILLKIATL